MVEQLTVKLTWWSPTLYHDGLGRSLRWYAGRSQDLDRNGMDHPCRHSLERMAIVRSDGLAASPIERHRVVAGGSSDRGCGDLDGAGPGGACHRLTDLDRVVGDDRD